MTGCFNCKLAAKKTFGIQEIPLWARHCWTRSPWSCDQCRPYRSAAEVASPTDLWKPCGWHRSVKVSSPATSSHSAGFFVNFKYHLIHPIPKQMESTMCLSQKVLVHQISPFRAAAALDRSEWAGWTAFGLSPSPAWHWYWSAPSFLANFDRKILALSLELFHVDVILLHEFLGKIGSKLLRVRLRRIGLPCHKPTLLLSNVHSLFQRDVRTRSFLFEDLAGKMDSGRDLYPNPIEVSKPTNSRIWMELTLLKIDLQDFMSMYFWNIPFKKSP